MTSKVRKPPRKRQKITHTVIQADEASDTIQLFPKVILPKKIYIIIVNYLDYHLT